MKPGGALLTIALATLGHWPAGQAQSLKQEGRLHDRVEGQLQGAVLAMGTELKVLGRQGFWVQVDAGGRTGWIKASGVFFGSDRNGVVRLDTGRLGSGNIVAGSATRGLSAKDLLEGAPRPQELARLSQFTASVAAQQEFKNQGALRAPAMPVALQAATGAVAGTDGVRAHEQAPPVPKTSKGSDEW